MRFSDLQKREVALHEAKNINIFLIHAAYLYKQHPVQYKVMLLCITFTLKTQTHLWDYILQLWHIPALVP